jgi:DNA-directed RNA polymerase specialized sigma24 family protein
MPVTRPKLSPDEATAVRLRAAADNMDAAKTELKAAVVTAKAQNVSFHEIARITGVSTNTLQAWVREAKRRTP